MADFSDIHWLELFTALDHFIFNLAVNHEFMIFVILFLIIFLETALLPFTFFPGDSLLFVTGAVAATGAVDPVVLMLVLISAAILGNAAGFMLGKSLGKQIYKREYSWLDREKIDKTRRFYEKHGAVALIIARFIPVVRSGAPLVAGAAGMPAGKFHLYSIIGAAIWVISLVGAGLLFGDIPAVKDNLGIILILGMSIVIVPITLMAVWQTLRKIVAQGSK